MNGKTKEQGFENGTIRLTAREVAVLAFIAKGFSSYETADLMNIKLTTFYSHRKSLFRKLDVRTDGEAVFEGFQLGIFKNILEESK